ncbi:DNA translocase FtsK [Neisseria animalis]|uniref:DNA translocase FtsK n=1 Tax=Neisseria animalis TaxID=492 RepID=A0A5P3MS44_NEIAN|nr:DNA translocase FtsK [Neisseria animalis]QEY24394.1 DNA translocase FtsK [Neisseria animalis]ROW31870.1 DNA translocase FtsK [Neisseria animalis]VEE06952.1 cell division protein FtsK [Neisseria animalis]
MTAKKTPAKSKPTARRSKTATQQSAKLSESLKAAKALQKSEEKKARPEHVANLINDTLWLFGLVVTVYLAIALLSFDMADPAWSRSMPDVGQTINFGGLFGAYLSDIGYYLFGLSFWWWIIASCVFLYKNFRLFQKQENHKPYNHGIAMLALALLLVCSPVLEHFALKNQLADSLPVGAGGLVGNFAGAGMAWLLGTSGSLLIMLVVLLLAVSLLTQVSWLEVLAKTGRGAENAFGSLKQKINDNRRAKAEAAELPDEKNTRRMIKEAQTITAAPVPRLEGSSSNRKSGPLTVAPPPKIQTSLFETPEEPQTAGEYQKPSLSLLSMPSEETITIDPAELERTAAVIESKLAEYNIGVEVVSATSGPTITRFEIEPAQGVRGSQIVSCAKDLARPLSLPATAVRVVESIAGKSTMGIEIPNAKRQSVLLREMLASPDFAEAKSKLTVALGKDISGTPVFGDLTQMPHMLVAGMTKSGKSVGINAMILSILYRATPDEVRFIMIDPKMIELAPYNDIPHLLSPVITQMNEAGQALNWCVAEMEKRYRLLAHAGVRNMEGFNAKVEEAEKNGKPLHNPFSLTPDNPEPLAKLPYIVIVIDEFADLIMTERKSVETQVTRIAQKARAAGMHMIIATQKPTSDIFTGLIKANVPTRLAFTVAGSIDSRVIIDQNGANNLLSLGDALFLQPGNAEPIRLQSPFASDEEVHAIAAHLREQAAPDYIDGLLSGEAALETTNIVNPNANSDDLFDQAVSFILESKKTSISALQRHLKIGYNRAANLMDALENAGIVTPADHNGSRRILAQKDHL